MKPKEAIIDLWKNRFFERVRTNREIDKRLSTSYGASTQNLTAVLNNCKKFLRRMGKAGWRQRVRYDEMAEHKENKSGQFVRLNIHPRIQKVSEELFLDGHYPQAIFEAFKAVNNLVKEKSKCIDLDGKSLMLTVFSKDNPILALNKNVTTSDKDEQEGFMHLFAGAMLGIRNPKAHDEIVQKDPKVTLQYIAFASLLCRMVDKATKVR